jgi:RNA polymerase sigma-70 factor, ECF subfamily
VTDDEQIRLITALKRRDRSAWSTAVDRYMHELYGFIFHLAGRDRSLAEDMNQETWLEAIDGIGQCDPSRGSFRNWLFGIARKRVALHYRRRALADREKGTAPLCAKGLSPFPAPESQSILPKDVLEQIEQKAAVRAAMLALPDDRRNTLVWKYVDGLSVQAIAERMGKTAKAVESLLSRSREQLRALLAGYWMPSSNARRTVEETSHE